MKNYILIRFMRIFCYN